MNKANHWQSSWLPYIYYLCISILHSADCRLHYCGLAFRTHDRDRKGLACCASKMSPWGAGRCQHRRLAVAAEALAVEGRDKEHFDWSWDGICLTPSWFIPWLRPIPRPILKPILAELACFSPIINLVQSDGAKTRQPLPVYQFVANWRVISQVISCETLNRTQMWRQLRGAIDK